MVEVGPAHSSASAMAFDGNDIYICGQIRPAGSTEKAIYWKNGDLTVLTDESTQSSAYDIALYKGDIYMCMGHRAIPHSLRAIIHKYGKTVYSHRLSMARLPVPRCGVCMFIRFC